MSRMTASVPLWSDRVEIGKNERVSQGPFIEVAVPLPVDETYDYALPPGVTVQPGARVLVPYSGRRVTGVVVAVRDAPSRPSRRAIRAIPSVVDATPVLPAALMQVVLRAAHDELCPPGVALAAAIPPGTAPRPGRRVQLLTGGRRALDRGEARGSLGRVLWALGRGSLPEPVLRKRFPDCVPALERLERIGWIERVDSVEPPRVRLRTVRVYRLAPPADLDALRARLRRAKRQLEIVEKLAESPSPLPASAPLRALVEAGIVQCEEREVNRGTVSPPLRHYGEDFELTPAQREATARIVDAAESERSATFLLYGITGSGKTEVYLRAAERATAKGRGAIVLVPEISLTHQVVDRFRVRFGDRIAVLHSGLSDGERFDQWRGLREGRLPIAIGARSAIFAPIEDLGLIVIDEEHDGAYKSGEGFRYHARHLAELRSRDANCPLVLGSATPDVETSYRADLGEIERLVLPQRVERRPLPDVQIVDMEKEPRARGRRPLLSRPLRGALVETLAAGRQAILFLNRRGFATLVYCFACGFAVRCKHCDISLVYHSSGGPRRIDRPEEGELHCHYCGYSVAPTPECPSCGSPDGALFGFGTERVQEEVQSQFPDARIERLDRDTSSRKGAQRQILRRFHRGEIDVLVGTQMVAKGHDVPGVTLVGVIAADLGLHFPDFRAGERTFQLLAQVAGRAGRGDDPGKVVIQTFLPDHYAIALARTHDYPAFCREELKRRRPHAYPPYRTLVQLLLSGRDEAAVREAAELLARLARSAPILDPEPEAIHVLGPAPAPITKIRDRFRWQVLLLGRRDAVREVGRELAHHARRELRGAALRVDASPLQML
jgi:primosomal protein N' (replication factor Y)